MPTSEETEATEERRTRDDVPEWWMEAAIEAETRATVLAALDRYGIYAQRLHGQWPVSTNAHRRAVSEAQRIEASIAHARAALTGQPEVRQPKAQVTVGLSRIGPHGPSRRVPRISDDRELGAVNEAYRVMCDDTDLPDDFDAAQSMAMAAIQGHARVEAEQSAALPDDTSAQEEREALEDAVIAAQENDLSVQRCDFEKGWRAGVEWAEEHGESSMVKWFIDHDAAARTPQDVPLRSGDVRNVNKSRAREDAEPHRVYAFRLVSKWKPIEQGTKPGSNQGKDAGSDAEMK